MGVSFDGLAGDGGTTFPTAGMQTTGKFLVLLPDDGTGEGAGEVHRLTGIGLASSGEVETGTPELGAPGSPDGVVFEELGVAVVQAEPEQAQRLATAAVGDGPIMAVERERVVWAVQEVLAGPPAGAPPGEYLRGYRDAVVHLADGMPEGQAAATTVVPPTEALDETEATWGLQATRVLESSRGGAGVNVAVLDTGLDLGHPDFAGRQITAESFVPEELAQDGHGHGTHCIGTACGPLMPEQRPRYGIAHEAAIHAGKVLSNQGSGTDQSILAGIEWAIRNRCQVVSMSLGAPVLPGTAPSLAFERVAQRAMSRGTLIIAAAGNDSRRRLGEVHPVSHPANCPSIMAVGALDARLEVADFSNGSIDETGGQIDIAAPGVAVHSTWPMPTRYRTINGTSMATPHVAGVAALLFEANPGIGAADCFGLLMRTAQRLARPSADVGAGLVRAPA